MTTRRLLTVSALVATLLPMTGAGAVDDNIGTTTAPTVNCGGKSLVWNTSGPNVVTVAGIITSLTFHGSGAGTVSLKVMRNNKVLATTTSLTVPATGSVTASGLDVHVKPGDSFGEWSLNDQACTTGQGSSGIAAEVYSSDPPVGTGSGAPTTGAGSDLSVSGVLEQDSDGDGFGDLTQDSCPADPTRHSGSCVVDLALTAQALAGTVGLGDLTVVQASVKDLSTDPAATVGVGVVASPGLQLVAASVTCSVGTSLSCPLGTVAAGGTGTVLLIFKGIGPGAQHVDLTATQPIGDPVMANNSATVPITVEQRAKVECIVPKVKGQTTAVAKLLLAAKGCSAGTVRHTKKGHATKGTVTVQSPAAGSHLPSGTKVSLTVRS